MICGQLLVIKICKFVQLFGKVVFGIDDSLFETVLDNAKNSQGVKMDGDLNETSLRSVVSNTRKYAKTTQEKSFHQIHKSR